LLGYALVICSQGAVIYKSQLKLCELSYNSAPLLKHPLTNWRHLYAMKDELGVTISNLKNRLQDLG
jgi:hypothetical protein